jgi:phosphohistidine phosphatase
MEDDMKTLLLMRHAKSSWKHPELPDLERPLNKRGRNDVPLMAKLLKAKELIPQLILSSTSVRARETVDLLAEESGFQGEVSYRDQLYLAESNVYLDELTGLPDGLERVMVVGHNPGLEGLVQIMSEKIEAMPTGSIAYIVLPIKKWNELKKNPRGDLVEFWRPRNLKEKDKEKEKDKSKEKPKTKGKEKAKKKKK